MAGQDDDLDNLLNSALDEVDSGEDDETADLQRADLSNAVKQAAESSAQAAKEAEENAARAAAAGGGLDGAGFSEADATDLLKQLEDPEFAKTLEETIKGLGGGQGLDGFGSSGDDENLARTLKSLSEAAQGLEGADAGQAEAMGDQIMNEMMKSFSKMGDKEDFQSMIDGMMQQLLSREVMYEPIKQVCEKFPEWLADNKGKLDDAEYERFGKQYQYYQRILATYDTEPDNFGRLSELLQEVQEFGQPPVEILKELAPGLEIGEDGVPIMPTMGGGAGGPPPLPPGLDPSQLGEGCAQQ